MFPRQENIWRRLMTGLSSESQGLLLKTWPIRHPPSLGVQLDNFRYLSGASKTSDSGFSQRRSGYRKDFRATTENGKEAAQRGAQDGLEASVRRRLRHMTDHFHISAHVDRLLQTGSLEKQEEALLVVRTASSMKIKCTVAWNHIFKHLLAKQQLRMTLSLLHEVPWLSYLVENDLHCLC